MSKKNKTKTKPISMKPTKATIAEKEAKLEAMAVEVGAYYNALIRHGVPHELAEQLTSEFHQPFVIKKLFKLGR